jgi:hypothetical protein
MVFGTLQVEVFGQTICLLHVISRFHVKFVIRFQKVILEQSIIWFNRQ